MINRQERVEVNLIYIHLGSGFQDLWVITKFITNREGEGMWIIIGLTIPILSNL